MSIYTDNGYSSREDYLNLLRLDYGKERVDALISTLPATEDFDGLIVALDDSEWEEDEEDEEGEEEDEWEDDNWDE
jgi:hypothetical protein